jgi:predicted HNH restriction endonuclease
MVASVEDMIPVYPNCHSMIQQTEPPLTIEQLKQHIKEIAAR